MSRKQVHGQRAERKLLLVKHLARPYGYRKADPCAHREHLSYIGSKQRPKTRPAKEIRIRVQIYEFQYEFAAYLAKLENGNLRQPEHNQAFAGYRPGWTELVCDVRMYWAVSFSRGMCYEA